MSNHQNGKTYSLEEALKAQAALRTAADLQPEQFPIQAFVGMISDEIQVLRQRSSNIRITAQQIGENYATPEKRHSERS